MNLRSRQTAESGQCFAFGGLVSLLVMLAAAVTPALAKTVPKLLPQVERWGMQEIEPQHGRTVGNPFQDVTFSAEFTCGDRNVAR
jgi:hypothetical protein